MSLQDQKRQRLRLKIQGTVQGVGFRPFIYRLAIELKLVGWIKNSAQGVLIEVEGNCVTLETFQQRLCKEKPARSQIHTLEASWLDLVGYTSFEIRASEGGEKTAVVMPDLATCADCLREIFDSNNRRNRYPFTNCTNCGPRYSIIEALPYDRCNTTMKGFQMCPQCQSEYENPLNRRFHAQPNACPQCGPHLELWDIKGKVLATHNCALFATADAIRTGKIVAVKGLGGFQLLVDAGNSFAVNQLRQHKQRSEKPFALMYPSLERVKEDCHVTPAEEKLLRSPEAPIVLLKQKSSLAAKFRACAPGNPYLGVMLPYTPLHHLLMAEFGFPVVATSGNLSDEPICTDEQEALQRLGQIAELFLIHNRPIVRPIDDSVVRIVGEREIILRRARGYAPLPISVKRKKDKLNSSAFPPILAVGAYLKNTVAIASHNQVFISQHIGDLQTTATFAAFKAAIASLKQLYEFESKIVACDLHPDYLSTQFAQQMKLPVVQVQHHYAHVLSCMLENQLAAPVLGIAWDGTGYGLDGTIWGGEFLYLTSNTFRRVAHLRTFRLPGGEQAIKEPRRVALGLLYEIFGNELFKFNHLAPLQAFSAQELTVIKTMLGQNFNTPVTSSAGRLFDAISALLKVRQKVSFEGQAAMELEFALEGVETNEHYAFEILTPSKLLIVDWAPLVKGILEDIRHNLSTEKISAKFHNTLVEIIVTVAKRVEEKQVILTGGCFQNKYLTERVIKRLREENFCPYWHQQIPPNDGGIALGQVAAVLREVI